MEKYRCHPRPSARQRFFSTDDAILSGISHSALFVVLNEIAVDSFNRFEAARVVERVWYGADDLDDRAFGRRRRRRQNSGAVLAALLVRYSQLSVETVVCVRLGTSRARVRTLGQS